MTLTEEVIKIRERLDELMVVTCEVKAKMDAWPIRCAEHENKIDRLQAIANGAAEKREDNTLRLVALEQQNLHRAIAIEQEISRKLRLHQWIAGVVSGMIVGTVIVVVQIILRSYGN